MDISTKIRGRPSHPCEPPEADHNRTISLFLSNALVYTENTIRSKYTEKPTGNQLGRILLLGTQ